MKWASSEYSVIEDLMGVPRVNSDAEWTVDSQTSVDVVLPNSMMQMQDEKSTSRRARVAGAVLRTELVAGRGVDSMYPSRGGCRTAVLRRRTPPKRCPGGRVGR